MPTLESLTARFSAKFVTRTVDIVQWVEANCFIEDPRHNPSKYLVKLWKIQKDYLYHLVNNKHTVTLKARQEGFTWMNIYYILFMCAFRDNFRVIVISQNKKTAKEVIRRIYFVLDNMPSKTKAKLVLKGRRSSETINFENGGIIESFGTTKNSARGFAGSCVFMDEADSIMNGEKLYQAAKPTIDDGGDMHIVFTVNDTDGLGRKVWELAAQPESTFQQFFCAWFEHPNRDEDWYKEARATCINVKDFEREFPSTPAQALSYSAEDCLLFLDKDRLDAVKFSNIPEIFSRKFVCGIDAGLTDDTFSYTEAAWHPTQEIPVIIFVKTWVPENGKVLDFDSIFKFIERRLSKKFPEKIFIDPLHIQSYADRLEKYAPVQVVQQGKPRVLGDTYMTKCVRTNTIGYLVDGESDNLELFEEQLLSVKLKSNLGNYRFIKKSSKSKIDSAVASSMTVYGLFLTVDYFPLIKVQSSSKFTAPQLKGYGMQSLDLNNLQEYYANQIRGMQ